MSKKILCQTNKTIFPAIVTIEAGHASITPLLISPLLFIILWVHQWLMTVWYNAPSLVAIVDQVTVGFYLAVSTYLTAGQILVSSLVWGLR